VLEVANGGSENALLRKSSDGLPRSLREVSIETNHACAIWLKRQAAEVDAELVAQRWRGAKTAEKNRRLKVRIYDQWCTVAQPCPVSHSPRVHGWQLAAAPRASAPSVAAPDANAMDMDQPPAAEPLVETEAMDVGPSAGEAAEADIAQSNRALWTTPFILEDEYERLGDDERATLDDQARQAYQAAGPFVAVAPVASQPFRTPRLQSDADVARAASALAAPDASTAAAPAEAQAGAEKWFLDLPQARAFALRVLGLGSESAALAPTGPSSGWAAIGDSAFMAQMRRLRPPRRPRPLEKSRDKRVSPRTYRELQHHSRLRPLLATRPADRAATLMAGGVAIDLMMTLDEDEDEDGEEQQPLVGAPRTPQAERPTPEPPPDVLTPQMLAPEPPQMMETEPPTSTSSPPSPRLPPSPPPPPLVSIIAAPGQLLLEEDLRLAAEDPDVPVSHMMVHLREALMDTTRAEIMALFGIDLLNYASFDGTYWHFRDIPHKFKDIVRRLQYLPMDPTKEIPGACISRVRLMRAAEKVLRKHPQVREV
jgi:hypothetical protein